MDAKNNYRNSCYASEHAPITEASVLVKGTLRGTNTDNQGKFSIVANPGEILVVSSVAFAANEIPVTQSFSVNITLQANSAELTNVVVVGYGT